ncbi:MAG: hypothetical protein KAG62_03125, partial [Caulobacter sp.]|nr:hypothetical protein [Caulobacter sp.]
MPKTLLILTAAALLLASAAQAQVKPPAKPDEPAGRWGEAGKKAVDIGSQPVRDVGLSKREVPPILAKAFDDPYNLKGLKSC